MRILLTTNHPVFLFWGSAYLCFYNDAFSRSLGPEKHPSILGKPGLEAWAETWGIIGPQIEQVMSGGAAATWHENQLVPLHRHGRLDTTYWTYSYGPSYDETSPGDIGGVLVLCTETTAQVLSEQRLRAAESRWRSLFNQSPGFVCVLAGREHRYEYANERYLQLVGKRDLIGHTVMELFPEVQAQGFVDLLDRVYRSGEPYVASAAPLQFARSGELLPELRYVEFVYEPVKSAEDRVTGIFVAGSDVTIRKLAVDKLRASEQRFQTMADGVPAPIWITKPDGSIEFVNREFCLFFGVTHEQVQSTGWCPPIHPEDLQRRANAFATATAKRAGFQIRVRVQNAYGVWCTVECSVVPRILNNSDFCGFVGLTLDMTPLISSQQALREADRRKDEFLATLVHELRNPLAPIRNAARRTAGRFDRPRVQTRGGDPRHWYAEIDRISGRTGSSR